MVARRTYYHGRACPYCKRSMDRRHYWLEPTRDHVVPESRGGRAKIICCRLCNTVKGDAMPERWAAFMIAYPGWWLRTKAELRRAWRTLPADASAQLVIEWPRPPVRQGSPPAAPVVVPPELIFGAVVELTEGCDG